MVKIIPLFFIVISFFSNNPAQKINAAAEVDSANYEIGDFINYKITVNYDDKIKLFNPVLRDSLLNVEVIRADSPVRQKAEEGNRTEFNFIVAKYDSGDVTIPPVAVLYQVQGDTVVKTAFTNPVTFTVHTLPVEQNLDIKDVKEPLKIPLDWKVILLWFFIGLAAVLLAYFLYRKYLKKKALKEAKKEIITIPPHVKALKSLQELKKKQLWQKGYIKEYHSEITEIIRKYFEDQFFLPALEMPTSEMMEQLIKRREVESILDTTRSFLNNADMVKFAKFKPMDTVNEEMMNQAVEIINKTRPREKNPEAANV